MVDDIVQLNRIHDLLLNKSAELMGGLESGPAIAQSEPKMTNLIRLISRAFRGESRDKCRINSCEYKTFITEEKVKLTQSVFASSLISRPSRKLSYWAFSPGIALEELKRLGVNSIILTSGTLSPLSSFQLDMKVPFAVQLENPHVIKDSQVWVGAVSTGADSKKLNSSYQFRDTSQYQDSLGSSIVSILKSCSSGIITNHGAINLSSLNQSSDTVAPKQYGFHTNQPVPNTIQAVGNISSELCGGILVFFQSYDMMDKILLRWKTSGIYEQLLKLGGDIIIEPRGNSKLESKSNTGKTVQKSFAHAAESDRSEYDFGNDQSTTLREEEHQIKDIVSRLDKILLVKKRCLVMAVFQGKISEGVDFKDSRGRIIIVTGIPFAPMKDPWIVLKKQYLDERKVYGDKQHVGICLNGNAWYFQSASRAVNQVISHLINYG